MNKSLLVAACLLHLSAFPVGNESENKTKWDPFAMSDFQLMKKYYGKEIVEECSKNVFPECKILLDLAFCSQFYNRYNSSSRVTEFLKVLERVSSDRAVDDDETIQEAHEHCRFYVNSKLDIIREIGKARNWTEKKIAEEQSAARKLSEYRL